MSGGGGSSSTVKVKLPGYIQDYSQDVLNEASKELYAPYRPYQGVRVPDYTPLEQNYLAQPYKSDLASATDLAGQSGGSWIDPGVAESYINPYIKNVADISAQEMERQYQKLQKNAKSDAISLGAWGDQQSGIAQSERDREYLRAIGDMYTGQMANAYTTGAGIYNQDRAAKGAAASLFANLGTTEAGLAKDAAGYQRGIEQMKADAAYQDWIEQRDWKKNTISWFSQILGQQPSGQTSTSGGSGADPWSTGVGAAITAASIAAKFI